MTEFFAPCKSCVNMKNLNDPNNTQTKLAERCIKRFNRFNSDPLSACPENAVLKYGCIESIGKDLIYNRNIVPPKKLTPEQIMIRQSVDKTWAKISQEQCVDKRVNFMFKDDN